MKIQYQFQNYIQQEAYDPILIFKEQGIQNVTHPELETDSFILAIQTHGTNAYYFKLITCIVVDNYENGKYKFTTIVVPAVILFLLYRRYY